MGGRSGRPREFSLDTDSKGTKVSPRAPGDRATIRVWLDGSVHMYWKDKLLKVEEFTVQRKEESLAYSP
mgnify:CR=1 FL=1|jgi:hypothetical protein